MASERDRLAIPPDPKPGPHDFLSAFPAATSNLDRDSRGKDSYHKDIQTYLRRAKLRWFALIAAETVRRGLAPIELQIVNPTERNFAGVEVVELPDEQMAWMSDDDVYDRVEPPKPAQAMGAPRAIDILSDPVTPRFGVYDEVERDGVERRVRSFLFTSAQARPCGCRRST